MRKMSDKNRRRIKRKIHIRRRLNGTVLRPRLTVTRSNKNLYMQVVDDDRAHTLVSISTLEKDFSFIKPTVEGAGRLGEAMGMRLRERNITTIVFDRNGYVYHGVVRALADGVRKVGIAF